MKTVTIRREVLVIRLEHDVGTRRLKMCVGLALKKLLEYVGKAICIGTTSQGLNGRTLISFGNIKHKDHFLPLQEYRVQRLWLTQYKN